jgi:hypothetical protein
VTDGRDIRRRDNGSVGRLVVAWRGDRRRRSELVFFNLSQQTSR